MRGSFRVATTVWEGRNDGIRARQELSARRGSSHRGSVFAAASVLIFGVSGLAAAQGATTDSASAWADETPPDAPPETVEPPADEPGGFPSVALEDPVLHGFVSQGFMLSTDNDFLTHSSQGSFSFTEVALNFNWQLTQRLRAAIQLFSRNLGPFLGDLTAGFDWFFLDWRQEDWLGLRVGRIRLPFGLYNEVAAYDPGRTAILMPQALYPQLSRDFRLTVLGGEIYGTVPVGGAGFVGYRLYGGASLLEPAVADLPAGTQVEVPRTLGGQLLWDPPIPGLRLSGSLFHTRPRADLSALGVNAGIEAMALSWVASAEYARGELIVAAEYSRARIRIDSEALMLIPSSDTVSESFYVSAYYGFTPWLNAGGYYAARFPDVEERRGREQFQHNVAMSLRFDINHYWLFKLEGHYFYGTALLSPRLNEVPNAEAVPHWGMFLAKTTVHF